MRLAILALSAAAISGCSWLGGGGSQQAHYTAGCYPASGGGHGYQQAGYQHHYGHAQGAGCAGGVYGVQSAGAGYGAGYGTDAYGYQYGGGQSYAAQGHGGAVTYNGQAGYAGAQAGYAGAQAGYATAQAGYAGGGYAAGGYASAGATTLNAAAPYGSAVSAQYAGVGQYASAGGYGYGQAGGVQTIVGAPIYVPQSYPAPQLRGSACCGGGYAYNGGGAMRIGIEAFGGTEFSVSGDAFTRKPVGPPDGDFTELTRVGGIDAIGYDDAFGDTTTLGLGLTYDLSPNTTLLGTISQGNAEGGTVAEYTTVQPGTWSAAQVFTPTAGSSPRAIDANFTDLKTTTLEAGIRHYVGAPRGFRPYIGATAGFQHNNDVTLTQTYSDDGTVYGEREFFRSGWTPTASGTVGAELALSSRAAVGVESGIRWRDAMNSKDVSEDRVTIPLTLRGRLSF